MDESGGDPFDTFSSHLFHDTNLRQYAFRSTQEKWVIPIARGYYVLCRRIANFPAYLSNMPIILAHSLPLREAIREHHDGDATETLRYEIIPLNKRLFYSIFSLA